MRTLPRLASLCILLGLLSSALPAAAQAPDLFEGETEVADQGEAERGAGFGRALAGVAQKLAADPQQLVGPALEQLLAEAPSLVQQYRYRQDVDTSTGVVAYRQFLVARFDPEAVQALLGRLGVALWAGARPEPRVWLAIDDGRGPRLVTAGQANAVRALGARAGERGLTLRFPGESDGPELGLRAAWEGDAEAANALLGGATAQVQLIGRLYRSAGGWSAEWQLRESGAELARTQRTAPTAAEVLAAGADLAADELGRRFRELAQSGSPGQYRIVVRGIDSAAQYARLRAYLDTLPLVRAVLPIRAEGDTLTLQLDLGAGIDALRRLFADGAVLRDDVPLDDQPGFRMTP